MTEVLATCPCGVDIVRNPNRSASAEAKRKYCSRTCSGRYGGGRPPATHCGTCGWAKDAANTYRNRACRRCTLAAGRPDYVPGPRGNPNRPVKSLPKTEPVKDKPTPPAPSRRWLVAPGFSEDVPVRRTR